MKKVKIHSANIQRDQASHCAYAQAKIVPKNTPYVRLRNTSVTPTNKKWWAN